MATDRNVSAALTMLATDPRSRRRVAIRRRVGYWLLAVYGVAWLVTSIHPWHPRDWLLENLLVFASVPTLIWLQHRAPWGIGTNAALLAFFLMHSVGAHYTYAEVPYKQFAHALLPQQLDWSELGGRNHYDRLVHFMYGLLVQPTIRRLFQESRMPSRVLELVCVQCIVATSALYELIEWAVVLLAAPDLGAAYLGTQGDAWDAHKDILLALIGACMNSGLYLGCRSIQARRATALLITKDLP